MTTDSISSSNLPSRQDSPRIPAPTVADRATVTLSCPPIVSGFRPLLMHLHYLRRILSEVLTRAPQHLISSLCISSAVDVLTKSKILSRTSKTAHKMDRKFLGKVRGRPALSLLLQDVLDSFINAFTMPLHTIS